MAPLTILPVTVADLLSKRGRVLLKQHHEEAVGDRYALDVDEVSFKVAEAIGTVVAFGAFCEDMILRGYILGLSARDQFSARRFVAVAAIFVEDGFRSGGAGLALARAVCKHAAEHDLGVTWTAKHGSPVESIARYFGAVETETIYRSWPKPLPSPPELP